MLSRKIAEFIDGVHAAELPPETIRLTKMALLDWFGSVLRGGKEKPALIALRVLGAQGGSAQATLLPAGDQTSALNAALGNGIASHIMELDDVHRGSIVTPLNRFIGYEEAAKVAKQALAEQKTIREVVEYLKATDLDNSWQT